MKSKFYNKNSKLIMIIGMSCLVFSVASQAQVSWSSANQIYGATSEAARTLDLKASYTGNFHLAFSVEMVEEIRYAKWTDGSWTAPELVTSENLPDPIHLSLDLEMSAPYLIYNSDDSDALSIKHKTGSWSTAESVDETSDAEYFDLAMDSYSRKYILWTRSVWTTRDYSRDVVYSHKSGSEWVHETICNIESNQIRNEIAIAVDSTFRPHFVWYDDVEKTVKYAIRTNPGEFGITTLQTVGDCTWLDMVILNGDIPLIAYIDDKASGDSELRHGYIVGGSFYDSTVCSEWYFTNCAMAAADEEGFMISHLYFIFGTGSGFKYAYYWGGWQVEALPNMSDYNIRSKLAADWNESEQIVGLAFTDIDTDSLYFRTGRPITPTPGVSPTPTIPPSPTPPDCTELGCTITMPATDFGPGQNCSCDLYICNPNPETMPGVPVFAVLDVMGAYFFAPDFSDYNHLTSDIVHGMTHITILPSFVWPEGAGEANGIYWYAAMTDGAVTELVGALGQFEFGWHQ